MFRSIEHNRTIFFANKAVIRNKKPCVNSNAYTLLIEKTYCFALTPREKFPDMDTQ